VREKLGLIGVFAVVAAVWAAGYLWQTGRIELAPSASSASSAPSPEPSPTTPPSTSAPTPGTDTPSPGGPASPGPTPTRSPAGADGDERGRDGGAGVVQQQGPEARAAARAAQARADRLLQRAVTGEPPPTLDFRVATFNVLGATHTAGNAPRYSRFSSGTNRVSGMLQVLASRQVDVVGLQEFQPVQRAAFARRATGWDSYPGGSSFAVGTTTVAWRADRFELVEGRLTAMPFYGGTRAVPSVLLRDRDSGVQVWVMTVHNPADTGKYPAQRAARASATGRQIALARQLGAQDVPVVLTGDMNEKASYFCRFTSATGFTSPAGGRPGAGGCRAPADSGVDWIFGSREIAWTSYLVDRSSLVRSTTDHPVRVAGVSIDGADFPGAW
jgi:endonuclease/exonuclease/phosphatase family metal-dependent hydrolase